MNATAPARIYNVCLAADRRLIMRIEAESDFDARYAASRMTAWSIGALTTQVKPVESESGVWVATA